MKMKNVVRTEAYSMILSLLISWRCLNCFIWKALSKELHQINMALGRKDVFINVQNHGQHTSNGDALVKCFNYKF